MTYLALALAFLAATLLALAGAVVLRRPGKIWWVATGLTTVVMLVLTAVFDSLMIAADLFRFDEESLAGVYVGLAPIEDFAWPLAAVALVSMIGLLSSPRPSRQRDLPADRRRRRTDPATPGRAL